MQFEFHGEDHDEMVNRTNPRVCGRAVVSKFMKRPINCMPLSSANRGIFKRGNSLTSYSSGSMSTHLKTGPEYSIDQPCQGQLPAPKTQPSTISERSSNCRTSTFKRTTSATGNYGNTTRSCMHVHGSSTLTGLASSAGISNQAGYRQLTKVDFQLREELSTENFIEERSKDADQIFQHHVTSQSIIQFDPHLICDLKSQHVQTFLGHELRPRTDDSDTESYVNESNTFPHLSYRTRFMLPLPGVVEQNSDYEPAGTSGFARVNAVDNDDKCEDEDDEIDSTEEDKAASRNVWNVLPSGKADQANETSASDRQMTLSDDSKLVDVSDSSNLGLKSTPCCSRELRAEDGEKEYITDTKPSIRDRMDETAKDAVFAIGSLQCERESYQARADSLRHEIERVRQELDKARRILSQTTSHRSDDAWDQLGDDVEFNVSQNELSVPQKWKVVLHQRNSAERFFKVDWELGFSDSDDKKGSEARRLTAGRDSASDVIMQRELNSFLTLNRKVTVLDEPQYYEDFISNYPPAESKTIEISKDDSAPRSTGECGGPLVETSTSVADGQKLSLKRDVFYCERRHANPEQPEYFDEEINIVPKEEEYHKLDDAVSLGFAWLGSSTLDRMQCEASSPDWAGFKLVGIKKEGVNKEGTSQRPEGCYGIRLGQNDVSDDAPTFACRESHLEDSSGPVVGIGERRDLEKQYRQRLVETDETMDQELNSCRMTVQDLNSTVESVEAIETNCRSAFHEELDSSRELVLHQSDKDYGMPSSTNCVPLKAEATATETLDSTEIIGGGKGTSSVFRFWQERLDPSSDETNPSEEPIWTRLDDSGNTRQNNWQLMQQSLGNQVKQDDSDSMVHGNVSKIQDDDVLGRDGNCRPGGEGIEEYQRDMQLVQHLLRKYRDIPHSVNSTKLALSRGSRPNQSSSAEAPSDESDTELIARVVIENIDTVIECRSSSFRESRDPDAEFHRHADLEQNRETANRTKRSSVRHKSCNLTLGISPSSESSSTFFGRSPNDDGSACISKATKSRSKLPTIKDYTPLTESRGKDLKLQSTVSAPLQISSTETERKVGRLASEKLRFWEISN